MLRIHWKYHGDAKFQISLRWDIRNPVKKTPVLHLGLGVKNDKWVWKWSGSIGNIKEMLSFKFHEDWTSGTLSSRPLSSILELESRVTVLRW